MTARHGKTVAEGWVPLRHGIASSYNRGCRCDPCTARHAARIRGNGSQTRHRSRNYEARVVVGGRLVAVGREGRHGQRDTYNRYGCRCELCTQAQAAYTESRRTGSAA